MNNSAVSHSDYVQVSLQDLVASVSRDELFHLYPWGSDYQNAPQTPPVCGIAAKRRGTIAEYAGVAADRAGDVAEHTGVFGDGAYERDG